MIGLPNWLNKFRKVVSGGGGGPPTGNPIITGQSIGAGTRHDLAGLLGIKITLGATPITVTALGRWVISGNHNSHVMHLRNSSNVDITTCTVNCSGATAGQYLYGAISAQVLSAFGVYYIFSSEDSSDASELWNETDVVTVDPVIADWQSAYDIGGLGLGPANQCYVPVSALFSP
jgi:hypothetical protein